MPDKATIEGIMKFVARIEGVDAEAVREGLEIARLHRHVEQLVENRLGDSGLTVRQVEIMESLFFHEPASLTPAALADEVGLTRSAMTSALDSLERQGYTRREPHPQDRRSLFIILTESGREFMANHLPDRCRRISRILQCMSKTERIHLFSGYNKIIAVLEEEMRQGHQT